MRPRGSTWSDPLFRKSILRGVIAAGMLLGALAPPSVHAQSAQPDSETVSLTLGMARAFAARQHPGLLAEWQGVAVAEGELRQARAFRFNPDLSAIGGQNAEVQ